MATQHDWMKVQTRWLNEPDPADLPHYCKFLAAVRKANADIFERLSPNQSRCLIVGALMRVWLSANATSIGGEICGKTPEYIDESVACLKGFAAAMMECRRHDDEPAWLIYDKKRKRLVFPEFERNNVAKDDRQRPPAKAPAERSKSYRERKKMAAEGSTVTEPSRDARHAPSRSVTTEKSREEESREEKSQEPQKGPKGADTRGDADADGREPKQAAGSSRTPPDDGPPGFTHGQRMTGDERRAFIRRPTFSPGFEAFWAAYPPAGQRDKPAAMVVWVEMNLEPVARAVAARAREYGDWCKMGGHKVEKAGYWIKQGNFHERKDVSE